MEDQIVEGQKNQTKQTEKTEYPGLVATISVAIAYRFVNRPDLLVAGALAQFSSLRKW